METDKIKKCAQCGQDKPIEDFSKSYKNLCKACVAHNTRLKRLMIDAEIQPSQLPFDAKILQWDDDFPRFIPDMRTQIAIAAMQGLLASSMTDNDTFDEIARKSVACADALINELKKKKYEVEADK